MANLYLKTGTNQIIKDNASGSWKLAKDTNCCCDSGPCFDKTGYVPEFITATITGTTGVENGSCPDSSIFDGTWVCDAAQQDCYTCGWGEVFGVVGCCEPAVYTAGYSGNFSIITSLSDVAPSDSHPQHGGDCAGADGWTFSSGSGPLYWYTKLVFTCPPAPPFFAGLLRVCSSFYSDPIYWDSGTSKFPILGSFTMYKKTTRDAGFDGSPSNPLVCNAFSWDTIYNTGADNAACIITFPATIDIEVF